jgi:hypothetical protein
MDKSAAQQEALRLWRALPLLERQNHRQAVAFAAKIAPTLQFETLGDHDKVVEGWLVRDLLQTEDALRVVDAKAKTAALDRKARAIVERV